MSLKEVLDSTFYECNLNIKREKNKIINQAYYTSAFVGTLFSEEESANDLLKKLTENFYDNSKDSIDDSYEDYLHNQAKIRGLKTWRDII